MYAEDGCPNEDVLCVCGRHPSLRSTTAEDLNRFEAESRTVLLVSFDFVCLTSSYSY